jgi:hypothetical protein
VGKNRTLELIQLEQTRANAEKEAHLAKLKAQHQACYQAFTPIRKMLEEIKDVMITPPSGGNPVPLKEGVRDRDPQANIEFWDSYGRGFEVGCVWGNNGPEYFVVHAGSKRRTVTLDEAIDAFVKYLATRIPWKGAKE